ncbi:hypothetical protein I79_000072 [Cricetulus griseus]|uniref:Uncharacterized protein n=1 Tax=Cricetulus griseus TaxID=10029 RepID=G3GRC9_CRIGR|nr:hypothetical protein I79_000072 [Cricetulus griseus]
MMENHHSLLPLEAQLPSACPQCHSALCKAALELTLLILSGCFLWGMWGNWLFALQMETLVHVVPLSGYVAVIGTSQWEARMNTILLPGFFPFLLCGSRYDVTLKPSFHPGMVVLAYNPSTWSMEIYAHLKFKVILSDTVSWKLAWVT